MLHCGMKLAGDTTGHLDGGTTTLRLIETLRRAVQASVCVLLIGGIIWQARPVYSANLAGAMPYRSIIAERNAAHAARQDVTRPLARPKRLVTKSARNVPGDMLAAISSRLSVDTLDALPEATGNSQWQCLSEAIYFESRGEPLEGQVAVAEVILNRVNSSRYPDTICEVTRQGVQAGRRDCQFSFACDGRAEVMSETVSRERSEKLAALMMAGRPRTTTDGATHFHARYVSPRWARKMSRTASIGQHIFYRLPTRVSSR